MLRTSRFTLTFGLTCLLLLSSCGLFQGSSSSTSGPAITKPSEAQPGSPDQTPVLPSQATAAALPPGVLFADDFSNPVSGWDVRNEADAITDYRDGEFVIFVGKINTTLWSTANRSMTDLSVDVNARQVAGTDDNLFGIICRYQDAQNFYRFVIGGNGFAGITKRANGQVSVLSGQALTRSDAVNRGLATNHLRAVCNGDQLTLYVNDQLVSQVTDDEFPSGEFGLLASSGNVPGTEIHFDDSLVTQP